MGQLSATALLYVLAALAVGTTHGWTQDELDLYDLVEEVNANFYDVLGVSQVFNHLYGALFQ